MKKLYLLIFLVALFLPATTWGSECVGFENMAVKILRQESARVYISWNTSVVNKCNKVVSAKVQIQLVDSKSKSIGNGYHQVNKLLPNESRDIKNEKTLPSEIYFKIKGYYFKAREISASLD